MYWLLDYEEQENLRQRMIHLQSTILDRQPRDQSEQIFPFIGRKSRTIARTLIENLTDENGLVVDPFGGSGTFAYAALDAGRHVRFNEWEPYAYKMSTAPFRGVPSSEEYCAALRFIAQRVEPTMNAIYKTRCPNCGAELSFDGLFFDREPLEYYHPTQHERLGANGENVIFRNRRYRCHCGCTEKHYDDFDEAVRLQVEAMPCNFPNVELIENSRLNFTAPQYTAYQNLFSKRQQIALMTLKDAIAELPDATRAFFEDTFISIAHCGKYTDYRSKSQDNHCPENRLKETNLYHRFLEKLELVFLAATSAATDQGNPFVITQFNQEFLSQLRRCGLMRLAHPMYETKIRRTLDRFTTRNGAQYRLTGLSPYTLMNREMNAEIRLREFAPVVIEELTANGQGFTFEEYVIHLSSFMENGSREIINQLHTANRLIPELLNVYAVEDPEQGKFFARNTVNTDYDTNGREHLCTMDPYDFERLIADYFVRRGFVHAEVIGRSGDRGVDVLATNIRGEYELIQCKRYRQGNNIGSTPIQRVHSYMRTRNASRAWVITTSDFTSEGRDEARITNVTIMNGHDLLQSLEIYYPGRFCL